MKTYLSIISIFVSFLLSPAAENPNRVGTFTPFTRSLNSNATVNGFLSQLGLTATTSSNAIYIAYRTDGLSGDGSAANPYDGSTPTKLANILSNTIEGQVIYFYPSLNYSIPVKLSNGAIPYTVKSGQHLIGLGGMNAVKISSATNSALNANNGKSAVLYSGPGSDVSNVVIRGIWVDANADYFVSAQSQLPGGVLSNACGAIGLSGQNNTVEQCRISGTFGINATGSEDFPVFLSGPGNLGPITNEATILTRRLLGNTLRECEILWTNVVGNNWSYGGQSICQLVSYAGPQAENLYNRTKHLITPCVIENNVFIAGPGAVPTGAFCSGSALVEIRNNRMYYGGAAYNDTWATMGLKVVNNQVILGPDNVGIDIVVTTNDATHYEQIVDVDIIGNTFYRQTNSSAGAGSEYFIRMYSGLLTNSSTGNWLGAKNINILNNTFIGGTNRTIGGVFGTYRNLNLQNNLFKNLSIVLLPGPFSRDISAQNNVVENVNVFMVSIYGTTLLTTPGISDVLLRGNIFKSIRQNVFLGAADNLVVDGNLFKDYGLNFIGAGYQSKALFIFTNGAVLGSDIGRPGMITNVTVKNNIFSHFTNDTYTSDIKDVRNLVYVDNTEIGSGLVFGHGINSTNFAGPRIFGRTISWNETNSTVGPAGNATALPAQPLGYFSVPHPTDGRTNVLVPYYTRE